MKAGGNMFQSIKNKESVWKKISVCCIYLTAAILIIISDSAFARSKSAESRKISGKMIQIPAGKYIPFFKDNADSRPEQVKTFLLDAYPVTNKEFLEFVKANSKWQRSKVKKIFADNSYLKNWKGDTELGTAIEENAPVTNISWFAANAYAQWKGKRLPTVSEWEYAASASEDSPNGIKQLKFKQQILDWYSRPTADKIGEVGKRNPNYYGIFDMHGLVWEWVDDFNSIMISGESRGGGQSSLFCGSGGSGATDPGDYAAFMRYAMRSSLKANYTVYNLGFRCAKDLN